VTVTGIHHITAIAGEPQRTLDFYTTVLGLRLVKLTVNFDDPGTYHFYFGDDLGRPGTILTFFPWPDGRPGRHGTRQAATVALAIPPASLGYWLARLLSQGVTYVGPSRRFEEPVLELRDPDGLMLELIATPRVAALEPWADGPVPPEHAIRGLHGATIWEDGDRGTAGLLGDHLGFREAGQDGNRLRLEAAAEGAGTVIDLRRVPGFWSGQVGVGTIHHVAFRTPTEEAQLGQREELERMGLEITPVIDRRYFHSVYFREPGGVLFEIATDGPGFALDENPADLGSHLMLPPSYQAMREQIEGSLPPLRVPAVATGGRD
jgi:glyoxalase family protein